MSSALLQMAVASRIELGRCPARTAFDIAWSAALILTWPRLEDQNISSMFLCGSKEVFYFAKPSWKLVNKLN
jgi:hypothetical protein